MTEKDLRWDVVYGFQMLVRHTRWLAKHLSLAAAGLLGLSVLVVSVGALVSVVLVWNRQPRLDERWRQSIGQSPAELRQTIINQYPNTELNETARQLEELTTKLGIFHPMPGRTSSAKRATDLGPLDKLGGISHLSSQLLCFKAKIPAPAKQVPIHQFPSIDGLAPCCLDQSF